MNQRKGIRTELSACAKPPEDPDRTGKEKPSQQPFPTLFRRDARKQFVLPEARAEEVRARITPFDGEQ